MIYLDNAATTLHKPQMVVDAVADAMQSFGNCGRGAGERALDAARTIYDTREKTAQFFCCTRPDHVITTDLEHNSVLRPLYRFREQRGRSYVFAG
jgi:selenocysteine lyase/cysteine desulfurase